MDLIVIVARYSKEQKQDTHQKVQKHTKLKFVSSVGVRPLSGVGIPGLGNIKRYSTPGGIESLYRRKS